MKSFSANINERTFFLKETDEGIQSVFLNIENKSYKIDESIVELETNYIYLKLFLFALSGHEQLVLGDPDDLGFYADYILDSLDKIDEKFILPYKRVSKEEIIRLLRRLI